MNIQINAVKFKADPKLESYVTDRVSKLERMVDNATRCDVTLKVDKPESANNKIVEISLMVTGQTIFNSKQANSFEEAVVDCVESIKAQIEKYKNRN